MAAMLSISVDSVHKTKPRLRKRFNVVADTNLEDFITGIEFSRIVSTYINPASEYLKIFGSWVYI